MIIIDIRKLIDQAELFLSVPTFILHIYRIPTLIE